MSEVPAADSAADGDSPRSEAASLSIKNLNIQAADHSLLRETSLTIPGGKITVIVGGSGAGKSVLLRVLAGLLPPTSNSLAWQGEIEVTGATTPRPAKQNIGIVFQQFALFDELSPLANVQFAIDHRRDRSQPPTQTARQWLDELGVPANTKVNRLSGGQKQRLAIARTLAAEPPIVLYDEPTSGLDAASGTKVAKLIEETHRLHGRTSVIVTHDYVTLIPIADEVLLFDSQQKQLRFVPREKWSQIPAEMQPVAVNTDEEGGRDSRSIAGSVVHKVATAMDRFIRESGSAVVTSLRLPLDVLPWFPRFRWGFRFFAHYLRLVGGPSAWLYLILAGLIVGFTSTFFTFRFLPFRLYTQPLLIDELLASIGFALYRILVPILATILIAARCGAAVAADVGVKQYGGQIDALRTLGIRPVSYLLVPIVFAFVVATPVLEWLSFSAARLVSLFTFTSQHPAIGPYFWDQHFDRRLDAVDSWLAMGWQWVLIKNLLCGIGTATIAYYRGLREKHSASDVSSAITSTVLWTTLYVLIVHFIVALIEF